MNISNKWEPGIAPIAVVMISLNEEHNLEAVFKNLKGWAQEVFLVDSYSKDKTIDIALKYGVNVVQRKFKNFGDQWNFALTLPISAKWTMKLDPDERISEELKSSIIQATKDSNINGIELDRQWWLMKTKLSISDKVLRVWRSGQCQFSDNAVNEHPLVNGTITSVNGYLEHHDSPDLDHWLEKQNRYTSAEAINLYLNKPLAAKPKLFGDSLQRRMWVKKNFYFIPLRYVLLFFYYWIWKGLYKNGWVGYASSRLWTDVIRLREYKYKEMKISGKLPNKKIYGIGKPDQRVSQSTD
jgi:glycosyltransferase involved in cell wall biosynthesis